jgi:hypothetical protein
LCRVRSANSFDTVERSNSKLWKGLHLREFIFVDPSLLHLPPGLRAHGADPAKLARQISKHGNSLEGIPAVELTRGRDGHYRINDGVTRATRAARLRPGELIPAEVIEVLPNLDVTTTPQVREVIS